MLMLLLSTACIWIGCEAFRAQPAQAGELAAAGDPGSRFRFSLRRSRPAPTPVPTPTPVPAHAPQPVPAMPESPFLTVADFLVPDDHEWVRQPSFRITDHPLVRNEGLCRIFEPEAGKASYYYSGQRVASGGAFNPEAMTAAHRTLPFGTIVRCTRTDTGQSVVVVINDRGPFIDGRIIDLSRAAARKIDQLHAGIVPVVVEVLAYPLTETLASELDVDG